ncbi:Zinc finger protein [Pseudolycoriella hygida]|uniref:Zinc finger protein n=1 Tax=Pseudolycoriella hygida TaxID=35572 RepID=A0A9Q0RTR8_9DIPT|nr:Zinc finger protein [Pseudolycoriella hygida]
MLNQDLDDTHLCIKCNSTIDGLESYIRHRKINCTDKTIQINRGIVHEDHAYYEFSGPQQKDDKQFGFSYDIGHHSPSTTGKEPSSETNEYKTTSSKSLSESYDYTLGADVFFSSLELQSSSKKSVPIKHSSSKILTRKSTAAIIASHENEDIWINTPSDGSDKLLKAVNEISGTKKDSMFDLIRFHQDSPEPYDNEDVEEEEDDYHDAPPRTHTGGKWKPEHAAHQERHRLSNSSPQWDDRDHWGLNDEQHHNEDYAEDLDLHPSYTKGKWVPGTKIVKLDYHSNPKQEQVINDQYWCTTCNRKLASRIVYERHLKSNLHLKRSEPENELEEASRPSRLVRDNTKRPEKPSIYLNEQIYAVGDQVKKFAGPSAIPATQITGSFAKLESAKKKGIRKRRRYFIKCDCQLRLPKYLLGKHLISHYHYRRMTSFDIILQNIHKITLQSPYQCLCCRFYANTEEMFLKHWDSKEHVNMVESSPGRFWCNFCKFHCEDNNQMRRHLVNEDHQEVISAINRSVPIIIRKRTIIQCDNCHEDFFYNIQLRQHAKICCGMDTIQAGSTASDQYQSKYKCDKCNIVLKSRKSLQKHWTKSHSIKTYFCNLCELNFATPLEARKHRISIEHKVKSAKKRKATNLSRKCNKCGAIVEDVVKLKEHIVTMHPNDLLICSTCGMKFILSQELSRHNRDKKCRPMENHLNFKTFEISCDAIKNLPPYTIITASECAEPELNPGSDKSSEIFLVPPISQATQNDFGIQETMGEDNVHTEGIDIIQSWNCGLCAFQSESQSEYLLHEILHKYDSTTTSKFPCSICGKTFRKSSLRCHLRQHTNERNFKCDVCGATFARRSNLNYHVSCVHEKKLKQSGSSSNVERSFVCSICNKQFKRNSSPLRNITVQMSSPDSHFTAAGVRSAMSHTGPL